MLKNLTKFVTAAILAVAMIGTTNADITVSVNYSQPWQGFMNVFDLDRTGAPADPVPDAFVFGSSWGIPDLTAVFDNPANSLTLGPNTIGDPDPFWYIGGGAPGALGNKWMDANLYVQVDDAYAGMTVTFEGTVLSNTLTSTHTTNIFIRDFAPDFSSFNETLIEATPGAFSIDLLTDGGAGRHVQYGFQTLGENVWVTDVGAFGTVVVATVPEPAGLMFLGLGAIGLISRRRR